MKLLGFIAFILCSSAVMSLAEAEQGSTLHYTLLSFINIFLAYCIISIINLNERVKKLEKENLN